MANKRLTDLTVATALTSDNLIHIVNTGDTTQYSGGSSYKTSIGDVFNEFDVYVSGMSFNLANYDLTISRNDGVDFTKSLAILSGDLRVTGGTYNPTTGIGTFTNNSGGTFEISGFLTGYTDTFVTGGTIDYNTGTLTLVRSDGSICSPITGFTDLYVTGGTYSAGTLTLGLNDSTLLPPITGFTTGQTNFDQFNITIDGQGGVITTGNKTTFTSNFDGTIIGWSIFESSPTPLLGSCVIDTWKDTYSNYPPTNVDTIWSGVKPTLTNQIKNQSAVMNIPFSQGDVFTINVDSATIVQRVTLCIKVQR